MGFLDFLKDPLGTDALFGGGGGGSNNPAKAAYKAYSKWGQPLYEQAKAESDLLFGAAQATQQDIMRMLQEGYGNARANVADLGRTGMQGIADAQTQALGASQQAAISSGLSGSTAHTAANRGIASDTARNIANLQGTIGQLYSSLDVGQAGAEAQVGQGLANILQNQAGAAQNFLAQQFGAINATPIAAPQESLLQTLAGGAIQALPFAFL